MKLPSLPITMCVPTLSAYHETSVVSSRDPQTAEQGGTADDGEKQTQRSRFGQFDYFSSVRIQHLKKTK